MICNDNEKKVTKAMIEDEKAQGNYTVHFY